MELERFLRVITNRRKHQESVEEDRRHTPPQKMTDADKHLDDAVERLTKSVRELTERISK